MKVNGRFTVNLMRPLKDLFMHELLSTGSPEPPTPTPSSNVVTGTFNSSTPDSILTLNLDIPEGAYPIAILIRPTDGFFHNTPYDLLYAPKSITMYIEAKYNPYTKPAFGPATSYDTAGYSEVIEFRKKENTSQAQPNAHETITSGSHIYRDTDPGFTNGSSVMIPNSNTMKLRIKKEGNYLGFSPNVDYTYIVEYGFEEEGE